MVRNHPFKVNCIEIYQWISVKRKEVLIWNLENLGKSAQLFYQENALEVLVQNVSRGILSCFHLYSLVPFRNFLHSANQLLLFLHQQHILTLVWNEHLFIRYGYKWWLHQKFSLIHLSMIVFSCCSRYKLHVLRINQDYILNFLA